MPLQGLKDFFFRGDCLTRSSLSEKAWGAVIIAGLGAVFDSFTGDIVAPIFSIIGGTPDFSAIKPFGIGIGRFITTLLSFLIRISILYLVVVFPLSYFARRRSSEE